jgi:hypothetical protein
VLGVALAGPDGIARTQFTWTQGSPTPHARIQPSELLHGAALDKTATGLALYSQRLERKGALRLSAPALAVSALPGSGAARFLVLQQERFLLVDASESNHPVMVRQWSMPGLRGVIPVGRGALAYGEAGAFWLDSLEGTAIPECLLRVVVADASANDDYVALVITDTVQIWNRYGVPLATLCEVAHPSAVMALPGQLLLATAAELAVIDVDPPSAPRMIRSMEGLRGTRFVRSGIDGTIYLALVDGSFAQLAQDETGWVGIATFPAVPWAARAARSGRAVLHLGDGFELNVLRSIGAPEIVSLADPARPAV